MKKLLPLLLLPVLFGCSGCFTTTIPCDEVYKQLSDKNEQLSVADDSLQAIMKAVPGTFTFNDSLKHIEFKPNK